MWILNHRFSVWSHTFKSHIVYYRQTYDGNILAWQYKLPTYKVTDLRTLKTDNLALTLNHRRTSTQNVCLQWENSGSEQKSSESEEAVLTHGAAATGTPFTRPNSHFTLLQDRTRRPENEWLWEGEWKDEGGGSEQTRTRPSHVWHADDTSHMAPSLNIDWSALRPVDLSAHCSCPPDPGSVFSFREKKKKTCVT